MLYLCYHVSVNIRHVWSVSPENLASACRDPRTRPADSVHQIFRFGTPVIGGGQATVRIWLHFSSGPDHEGPH